MTELPVRDPCRYQTHKTANQVRIKAKTVELDSCPIALSRHATGKKRYGNVLTGYKAIMLPRFDSSEK